MEDEEHDDGDDEDDGEVALLLLYVIMLLYVICYHNNKRGCTPSAAGLHGCSLLPASRLQEMYKIRIVTLSHIFIFSVQRTVVSDIDKQELYYCLAKRSQRNSNSLS